VRNRHLKTFIGLTIVLSTFALLYALRYPGMIHRLTHAFAVAAALSTRGARVQQAWQPVFNKLLHGP
jgi:hypothetical protein